MALTPQEQVRELARLLDIPLAEEDVQEVATRFQALIAALEPLKEWDLKNMPSYPILPPEK